MAFANSSDIKLGQEVFLTAATTLNQTNWLAQEGIIKEIDATTLKTNIPQEQVMQGSPLFDVLGNLVGINYVDAFGTISVIPVNKIQALLGL